MINYVKSEVYRNLRSKGNYIFLFGCMVFVLFLNIMLASFAHKNSDFPYANTYFSFTSLYMNMGIPLILCLPMVSIVFGQEYKSHTLKNVISYGIARKYIYLGKFIITLVIGLINLILITGAYLISANLLLENSGTIYLYEMIRSIIACIPLFLVGATLAHCLYFIFESENTAIVLWIGIMIVVPKIMNLLGVRIKVFRNVASIMPWNIIKDITEGSEAHKFIFYWSSKQGLINCFMIGIVGAIIVYLIGLKIFENIEIK